METMVSTAVLLVTFAGLRELVVVVWVFVDQVPFGLDMCHMSHVTRVIVS